MHFQSSVQKLYRKSQNTGVKPIKFFPIRICNLTKLLIKYRDEGILFILKKKAAFFPFEIHPSLSSAHPYPPTNPPITTQTPYHFSHPSLLPSYPMTSPYPFPTKYHILSKVFTHSEITMAKRFILWRKNYFMGLLG